MKLAQVIICLFAVLLPSSTANAANKNTLADYLSSGFELVAANTVDEKDGIRANIFLQKGTQLVFCSISLKEESNKLISGPWNNYSQCAKLSGEASE